MLDCSALPRFEYVYEHTFCLSQTELYFTYIYKLSCILNTWINDYGHISNCATAWPLLCSKYQSSAVEAWYPISFDLHMLSWFYHDSMEFDHRSSVRTLDLLLSNKILFLCVYHFNHDYINFTYTCNFSCKFIRYTVRPYDTCVFYTCNFGHTSNVNETDQRCYIYIYYAYTLFFLFLPLSAYPKPRTAFLEEREDDEDLSMNNTGFACLNWKEILSLTDDYYKICHPSEWRQREEREDGDQQTRKDGSHKATSKYIQLKCASKRRCMYDAFGGNTISASMCMHMLYGVT